MIEQNVSGSSIKESCDRNAPSLTSFVHTSPLAGWESPNSENREQPVMEIETTSIDLYDEESECTAPAKEGAPIHEGAGAPCHIRNKTSYEFLPQKFSTPYLKSTREQFIKLKCHVLMHLPS